MIVIVILSVLCVCFVYLSINHYDAYIRTHNELIKLRNEYVELKENYSALLEHEQAYKNLTQKN